jgi:hypothetical protein
VALDSYGVTGLRLRAQYEMRRRLGLYLTSPRVMHVDANELLRASPFDVDLDRVAAAVDRDEALARADRVAEGSHEAYRNEWRRRPSTAEQWSIHPEVGTRYPAEPWWQLRRFLSLDPSHGDVKDVWEAARFTWVFDLVRGYAVTRDERYAESFWSAIESFVEGNPPFLGIQWSCGQETSIRALSCLWGERAFGNATSATRARRALVRDLLAWSGERVADAIEYAISQRNNHGISEATGLIALGHRLTGEHPAADQWLRDGAKWIEYLVMDQFGEDGWYIQHSLNYLRMALDQLVVAERVLVSARDHGLSPQARARIQAAIALLVELHDAETGDVPNHGANDGSMVLPVSTRPYRDFRPAITAAAATFGASLPESFRASPEALAWLGVDRIARQPDAPATRVVVGSSGWASVRNRDSRLFARAGSYESNPSHIDPAHVDIWVGGEPRTVDAGTYRYTAPPPWRNGLASIAVHNTVDIPSMPAAEKGARFLWLKRPAARITRTDMKSDGIVLEISNDTWTDRGVSHFRRCVVAADSVDVIDEIDVGQHAGLEIHVHWLLPDGAPIPEITSEAEGKLNVERSAANSVVGWRSRHYAEREPATSVTYVTRLTGRETVHSRFVATNLRPETMSVFTGASTSA